jgi:hypothetical protein
MGVERVWCVRFFFFFFVCEEEDPHAPHPLNAHGIR